MLAKRGVVDGKLDAILLTHEHTDHSIGAGPMARRQARRSLRTGRRSTAYAERDELGFASAGAADRRRDRDRRLRNPLLLRCRTTPSNRSAMCWSAATIAVRLFHGCRQRTPAMRERCAAHLAIVEANHDLEWLLRGPYTPEMKERVASATGIL